MQTTYGSELGLKPRASSILISSWPLRRPIVAFECEPLELDRLVLAALARKLSSSLDLAAYDPVRGVWGGVFCRVKLS
jgi:hypothetical protein